MEVRLSDGNQYYKATTPTDTQPISSAALTALANAIVNNRLQITPPTTQRTPALLPPTTTSGTVAAGKVSVTIANVGVANGIILGVSVGQGSYSWEAPPGDTLATFTYDATGTTFIISTLT